LKKVGQGKIFCFSDELDFLKEKLIPLIPKNFEVVIVDCNGQCDARFDLELMKHCKTFISCAGGFGRLPCQLCKRKDKQLYLFEEYLCITQNV